METAGSVTEAIALLEADGYRSDFSFMDGSVRWIKFDRMLFIHSWAADGTRDAYFFQEDLGEKLEPKRDLLRPKL